MEKIKAFIFDVDGVLVESNYANYVSLKKSLNVNFAIKITEQEDNELGPIPSYKKLEYFRQKFGFSVSPEHERKFLKDKFNFLIDEINNGTVKFNSEIFDIFSNLKKNGFKTAIVSNARKEYIRLITQKLNINPLVDVIVGNDSGLKAKPDPDMYNFAISSLNLTPSECVIFEDSEVGLRAARASGAYVIKIDSFETLSLDFLQENVFNADTD